MLHRIFWCVLLWVFSPAHAQGLGDVTAVVVGVVDGDTLDVTSGTGSYRIRLAAIDAPERSQAFGSRAKQALSEHVHGQRVSLRCRKQERRPEGQRQREICTVFRNGLDVNLLLVASGWAWHYKAYAQEQGRDEQAAYDRAEREAREKGRGLWIDQNAVAPWQFRRVSGGSTTGGSK